MFPTNTPLSPPISSESTLMIIKPKPNRCYCTSNTLLVASLTCHKKYNPTGITIKCMIDVERPLLHITNKLLACFNNYLQNWHLVFPQQNIALIVSSSGLTTIYIYIYTVYILRALYFHTNAVTFMVLIIGVYIESWYESCYMYMYILSHASEFAHAH